MLKVGDKVICIDDSSTPEFVEKVLKMFHEGKLKNRTNVHTVTKVFDNGNVELDNSGYTNRFPKLLHKVS